MSSASSGPPNPRHARYRQLRLQPWHGTPVTVILIALCCIVAIISKMGYDTKPVTFMFFANPPEQTVLEDLEERLSQLEENDEYDTEEYDSLMKDYIRISEIKPPPFSDIIRGQAWRVITPAFLHFGPMHLFFNMYWLWALGRMLESMLRRIRFVLLVALIAAGSNTLEAIFGGTNFGGMSGVIYGLFGYIVILGRIHPMSAPQLDPRTVRYMLIWLALCFTGFLGPIANAAHLSGLIIGGLVGALHGLRSGGWKYMQRKRDFHRAIASGGGFIHLCSICGKTEEHDLDLEFRVGSDGQEYCVEHLPASQPPH